MGPTNGVTKQQDISAKGFCGQLSWEDIGGHSPLVTAHRKEGGVHLGSLIQSAYSFQTEKENPQKHTLPRLSHTLQPPPLPKIKLAWQQACKLSAEIKTLTCSSHTSRPGHLIGTNWQ